MTYVRVRACDLCYSDGEIKEATHQYEGDGDVSYDACASHAEEIKGYDNETSKTLQEI